MCDMILEVRLAYTFDLIMLQVSFAKEPYKRDNILQRYLVHIRLSYTFDLIMGTYD